MLSQPQETLELQHRQSKAVAAMCLDFPYNDVNNFVIGSEEGAVYSGTVFTLKYKNTNLGWGKSIVFFTVSKSNR